MTANLRDQLQATLSGSYAIERELGGGGMSRVFLARETALGRNVVVKVLPPDLMEGVSVDRFKREIQVAAQLQHPHIVGVLSAGEAGGIPFYTMPFVDGMSLRARLTAAGALPMTEVIAVLRDVAKALGYAHEHGVVHRDIKPDNVLLTGGSAVVADFGIAKAIAAARTGARPTLTSVGSALGTPAYMAPEQAAADPGIDHRADIYAFGVMAYEMLAGKPPFAGMTPQRLLAAQMSEAPAPIESVRLDVPSDLADLVMRCLEKDPDKRPQRAADVVKVLEAVTSGGAHGAVPAVLLAGRPQLARALGLWAVSTAGVAIVARAAIIAIGLPDWVFPAALIVMGLGLPATLFTYFVHRGAQRALTMASTTPGGLTAQISTLGRIAVKASPHVTWRRTTMGGVLAVAALVLLVGGYMVLRELGIGPAGTLIGKGAIRRNERLVVADFNTRGADTSLASVVTELVRTRLGESERFGVMPATTMRDVLRRMRRDPTSRVDFVLAREIATREGIKAVVDGEVLSIGGTFAISARVLSAETGDPLETLQETAGAEREVIAAVDRLTRRMRERIGEPLRSIRDVRSLEQVTTPSLDALRKYVQGSRAITDGDVSRGVPLLEEAVALDSAFAMAYRRLAVELNNRGTQPVRVMELASKAFAHRDRLSDAERYLTEAAYYSAGPRQDQGRTIAAYESLLELQPTNSAALNNVSNQYRIARDLDRAQSAITKAVDLPDAAGLTFTNFGIVGMMRRDTGQVMRAIHAIETRFSGNSFAGLAAARLTFPLFGADSAAAVALAVRRRHPADATALSNDAAFLADMSLVRGRVAEALRWMGEESQLRARIGSPGSELRAGIARAWLEAWVRGNNPSARRMLEQTLATNPVAATPHVSRPYTLIVALLCELGLTDRAKAVVDLFDRERRSVSRTADVRIRHQMLGDIAMAERRYDDAQREYRAGDLGQCITCVLPRLASAYDLDGNADSAIAVYTRYLETPEVRTRGAVQAEGVDADFLAVTIQRLGELWEQKGDAQKAAGYYSRFVELWARSDAELQPRVSDVRRRLTRLRGAEKR